MIADLRAALASILDAAGFVPGPEVEERYRMDWSGQRGAPLALLRPHSTDALARSMAVLHM
jgi:FAD/FMN-containing dehydrogenase